MADNANAGRSQRSRIMLFGIGSLLALVICTGVVVGVAVSMITEGVYDFGETEAVESLTPMPENSDNTVTYLKSLLEKATDDTRVYVNSTVNVSVDEDTIKFSGTEHELNALMYMKDNLYSSIDEIYPENYEGKFADGYTKYPLLFLQKGEYSKAECTQGAVDDNGEKTDDGYYFINVTVPGGEFPAKQGTGVYNTFNLQDSEVIAKKIRDAVSSVVTVEKASITPEEFYVEAKADRSNDEISYAEFTRCYKVSLFITFTGEYAELGSRSLEFDYKICERYEYTWAGLTFEEDTVSISKKVSHPLPLKAVMNDDSEHTVKFESSDEKIATVDELGYVYGKECSKDPVTITAHLIYLGHEYTAECKVYVTVPVKKIKISDDELALSGGETKTLSASLEPKNVTITDIIWISEDESIVSVTQDGKITALKKGKTKIIAVAADGYFRDSCTVTVTD